MRPANERRRYDVTSSLIGWAHSHIDPCHHISLKLEAVRLGVKKVVPFWNLIGASTAVLPRRLWNIRSIGQLWVLISWLWNTARSGCKTNIRRSSSECGVIPSPRDQISKSSYEIIQCITFQPITCIELVYYVHVYVILALLIWSIQGINSDNISQPP